MEISDTQSRVMYGPLEFCSGRFLHSHYNPTMGSLMSRSGEEQYVLGGNEFSIDLVQIVLYYKTSSFVEYIAVYLFS